MAAVFRPIGSDRCCQWMVMAVFCWTGSWSFIVIYSGVSINANVWGISMGVEIMPGRKSVFLLKGQRKMRGIRIADLRCHYLYGHFVIQQFPGMLQFVLLVIPEKGLAIIFFEFGLQTGRTHSRNAG